MALTRLFGAVGVAAGLVLALCGASMASSADTLTSRPLLESAHVWWTSTPRQASASNPAGTTLEYHFLGYTGIGHVDPRDFIVYTADGIPHRGDSVMDVNNANVAVRFSDFVTSEQAAAITLATVRPGAVVDDAGLTNIDGAVPVMREHTITEHWHPFRLLGARVVAVRRHRTVVRFAFAEPSPLVRVRDRGFHLQLVDGGSPHGIRHTAHHRHRRTIIRMSFRGRFPTRRIARATVSAGAVTWNSYDMDMDQHPYDNTLKVAVISHRGRTTRPDLVRVKLEPSPDPRRRGHALFVFDQRVTAPRARRFFLGRTVRGVHAVRRRHHPRQVIVSFVDTAAATTGDAIQQATGAAVGRGAVRGGRPDRADVTNHAVFHGWDTANGMTAGPDLVPRSRFPELAEVPMDHQSPDMTVGFDFDEADLGQLQPDAFHLYLSDGTELDASRCFVAGAAAPGGGSEIRCTFTGLSPDQAAAAAIATVDAGAVHDSSGRVNPEGAGIDSGPLASPTNS